MFFYEKMCFEFGLQWNAQQIPRILDKKFLNLKIDARVTVIQRQQ